MLRSAERIALFFRLFLLAFRPCTCIDHPKELSFAYTLLSTSHKRIGQYVPRGAEETCYSNVQLQGEDVRTPVLIKKKKYLFADLCSAQQLLHRSRSHQFYSAKLLRGERQPVPKSERSAAISVTRECSHGVARHGKSSAGASRPFTKTFRYPERS